MPALAHSHERIIREGEEIDRLREYMTTNSGRWLYDPENPNRIGEDEFDQWLVSVMRKLKGHGMPCPYGREPDAAMTSAAGG